MISLDIVMPALLGGGLIGLAASMLLLFNGRILGVSGILSEALDFKGAGNKLWIWLFLLGLLAGPRLSDAFLGTSEPVFEERTLLVTILAGLLVGFGTTIGSGCTSGHGVCGIGRLSQRSIVSVCVFMGTAMVTVFVFRHVWGG
ncbi:MAG: YeeE/YedE family protein [Gammaproteobacteria bacterium]|nr:YeeE/YedE family protein [Gammaproteobacteria bacterium]